MNTSWYTVHGYTIYTLLCIRINILIVDVTLDLEECHS